MPEIEVKKFRFELKLWLVTNASSLEYLRWNQDRTVLVLNETLMKANWASCVREIFACETLDDFFWLLEHAGFEKLDLEDLDVSERGVIEASCRLYRHPKFKASNAEMFDGWLSDPMIRVHESNVKGCCSLANKHGFRVRRQHAEFAQANVKILTEMSYVEKTIRAELQSGPCAVEIPQAYIDFSVVNEPPYVKTKQIAGYYGPVSVADLQKCLGSYLPIYYDGADAEPLSQPAPDEEVVTEEIVTELPAERNELTLDAEEILQMSQENAEDMKMALQELYDSMDIYDTDPIVYDERESVIEIEEIFNAQNESPCMEGISIKQEHVPYFPAEEEHVPNSVTPAFFSNSIRGLISPIDDD
ncbi:uncharacterized protein LOC128724516 [Anopheles nili]|uniref:uncharacterized protein LOC128724516 n=1 Tax=Anopheles nili TaxID=185578 RepID=UPI00237B1602|nr:uncharacterized protein LOC128724516 [Anopheles nili]